MKRRGDAWRHVPANGSRRNGLAVAVAMALSLGGKSHAAEFAWGLGYVEERSSNVGRTAANEVSANTGSTLAGLAVQENSAKLAANVQAQAEYRNYRPDVFEDGGLYYVDAAALWMISPQQFSWSVADRYDYGVLNPGVPYTPANRTSYNIFETGPDYYFRLGPLNTIAVGARYGQMDYGNLNASNQRIGGSARWIHQISPTTASWVAFGETRVKHEEGSTTPDFVRKDAFARVDSRQGRMRFIADGGYTEIEPEFGESTRGPLVHLTWTNQLTSDSSAGLFGTIDRMDTGALALGTVTDPAAVAEQRPVRASAISDAAIGDTFEARSIEAFYETFGDGVEVSLRVFARKFDYDNVPRDRNEDGGSMEIRSGLTPTLTGSVFGNRRKVHFVSFYQDDVEGEVGVRLLYRVSREISFGLEGLRARRSSTEPTTEFQERRYLVSLLYSSGPQFTPAPRR